MERIEKAAAKPVLGGELLKRWLNRRLTRNPIGWLERRTWNSRIVTWGWLGVVGLVYAAGELNEGLYKRFDILQLAIAWLLILSLTAGAAGSFRRERESGFLELMLVAPLGEWQIISGRMRGLWGQFAPAVVVFLAMSAWMPGLADLQESIGFVPYVGIVFFTLPVIGLYFSLSRSGFLAAFLWTLLFGVVTPLFLSHFTGTLNSLTTLLGGIGDFANDTPRVWAGLLLQLVVASVFAFLLQRTLAGRKFLMT
jgi:ABC-type transport system involved in multi-copper enzyme maturation permease subunit